MPEKKNVIKCPKCGYEYLPAEVFFADKLLGKPSNICRNELGEIIYFDNDSLNTKESYICDNCGANLLIEGTVNFKAKEVKSIDWDEEWN